MSLIFKAHLSTSFLLIGLLVSACDHGGEGGTIKGGSEHKVEDAKPLRLSQINVLVDMSGGMQGFVHPVAPGASPSGFQRTVGDLLSDVKAQKELTTPPAYYFFKESTSADKRLLVPSSYESMSSTVSGGIKNAARGSELPDMLKEALKLQAKEPGTVSILISDFIFAPRHAGQTWEIKTFIKDALSEVEASKLAVSVFANTSEYRGNFYPGNRSGAQKLNGEKIPYYIWVLGDPTLVGKLDAGLLHKLAQQPQAHFNVRFAPQYAVLDYFEQTGSWTTKIEENFDAGPLITFRGKFSRGDTADVVVGLNLSSVPASIRDQVNKNTLHLVTASVPATLSRVLPLTQVRKQASAQPTLNQYTHFAKLRFVQAPKARETLSLVLDRPDPTWINSYSVDSDSDIKAKGAKTFRLKEVLQGVGDYFAGQPSAQQVFSLPLRVNTRD